MAKEGEKSTSSDKGKGKALESGGKGEAKRAEDVKKDKDGKSLVNGKKGEAPKEGEQPP
jgi:26S proteasome regulatory subunit N1